MTVCFTITPYWVPLFIRKAFFFQEFCLCKFSLRFSQQKNKCWRSLYTISLTWLDECISDLNNCWMQLIGPIQMTAFLSAHVFAWYSLYIVMYGVEPSSSIREFPSFRIVTCKCDYRRGLDGDSIYWPLIHDSELQVITALSLISTGHKSPQHPQNLLLAYCIFIGRSLATVSNNEDSSASRAQVLSS
jgi:hypothetical protein